MMRILAWLEIRFPGSLGDSILWGRAARDRWGYCWITPAWHFIPWRGCHGYQNTVSSTLFPVLLFLFGKSLKVQRPLVWFTLGKTLHHTSKVCYSTKQDHWPWGIYMARYSTIWLLFLKVGSKGAFFAVPFHRKRLPQTALWDSYFQSIGWTRRLRASRIWTRLGYEFPLMLLSRVYGVYHVLTLLLESTPYVLWDCKRGPSVQSIGESVKVKCRGAMPYWRPVYSL